MEYLSHSFSRNEGLKNYNHAHPFEPGSKEQEEFEAEYYRQTIVDPKCPLGIAIEEFEAKWPGWCAHSNYMTVTNKWVGNQSTGFRPMAEVYAEELLQSGQKP